MPEKEYLFSKNTSDHSTTAYKDLCEGVSITSEAVLGNPQNITPSSSVMSIRPPETDISFSAKIGRLQEDYNRLAQDIKICEAKLSAELKRRKRIEEELEQLRESNQQLQDKSRKYSLTAEYCIGIMHEHFRGLNTVLTILEGLKKDSNLVGEIVNA